MADNNEIEIEQKSPSSIPDIAEPRPPPPNIDLSKAMMEKNYKEVRRLCDEVPEGPLQVISIYDDTVLHMAAHSKQEDLVLALLNMIPEDRNHQLSKIKNTDGNTKLHKSPPATP